MSLDDVTNPHHAAALERGEYPGKRDTAQFRLASLLAEHDDIHSIHHQMRVAGRVLAFLPRINAWAEVEPEKRKVQLRQQQTSSQSEEDFFVEQAHYHLNGYFEAMGILSRMGSVHAADYDPDARGAAEDDARISREKRDAAAAESMPKGLAS